MLNIGFFEMVVIAGIALVVIGPEKFPEVAKIAIRMFRDFQNQWSDIKREVTSELRPIDKELRALTKYDPETYLKSLTQTTKTAIDDVMRLDKPKGEGIGDRGQGAGAAEEDVWAEDMGPYPYSGDIVAANAATAEQAPAHAEEANTAEEPKAVEDEWSSLKGIERI